MLAIISMIAPIFIVIALGYFTTWRRIVSGDVLRGMGRYVVVFALPALIFQSLASHPLQEVMNPAYFFGYAGGSLASFTLGALLARWRGQTPVASVINGFGQSFCNSGFIGYPLLYSAIGTQAGIYFTLNMVIENMLILPLFLLLGDAFASTNGDSGWKILRRTFFNTAKNPMIIAMILGIATLLGGWTVPKVAERTLAMLSSSGGAVALFVIGGNLYGLSLRGSTADIIQISIGKLIIHPILVSALIYLFGGRGMTLFAGTLLAGVTMGSIYPLLGERYGHMRRCSAAMLVTTIASMFTLSLILYFAQPAR